MFYAHSTNDPSQSDWHGLSDHLQDTSELAGIYAGEFAAAPLAELAGLCHDLGKYSEAFQRRIAGDAMSVDHSTAGAQEITALYQDAQTPHKVAAELAAYAVAGHHAGLADRYGAGSSLQTRLENRQIAPLRPEWRDEIALTQTDICPNLQWQDTANLQAFQLGFLGRMIFSCLVDADFRDTEAFYAKVEGCVVDRRWPALPDIVDHLILQCEAWLAAKREQSSASLINEQRNDILSHVLARAGMDRGAFTLTVPTGGGKTLTSLAFALAHAKRHGLKRIIYAIPFTSIIDQTARVFRDVLGDEVILEHHSNLEEAKGSTWQQQDKLKLAMEDWAAPVVVTTNVQLFESLFANRPSKCRKLHNLANSIIILDEAQTLPLKLLKPCMAALDELVRNYGVSLVLCTATQPALDQSNFEGGIGLTLGGRELAPDPNALAKHFRRVAIVFAGAMTDDDLVAALTEWPQALVIVNSRKHALALYRRAEAAKLEGLVHLSTRQHAADRRAILDDIRARLGNAARACRVIATSLVEAGVDLDFPRVWRTEAGLDQIAQAAGRCNREGKRPIDDSLVTVFHAPDNPPPREIAQLVGDFSRMADRHSDLLSPAAITDYFGEVYWRKGPGLDAHNILSDFSVSASGTNFAYRSVAEKFRMIESGMAAVIINDRPEVQRVLDNVRAGRITAATAARALQNAVVQVPPAARAQLVQNGDVVFEPGFNDQFAVLVNNQRYTRETGLLWDDETYLRNEDFII